MKPLLLLALALIAALPAAAQTQSRSTQVYRCGPEGRDLRDSPCPSGDGATAVAFDQPSAADSKAARDRQLADAKQAAALEKSRRASEAEARHQRALSVGLQAAPTPSPAASGPQVTTIKPPKTVKPKKPVDSGR